MARGLFTTGFTVSEVLAIQARAKERLEEQSRELEAAQMDPVAGIGGKKPRPATSPAS